MEYTPLPVMDVNHSITAEDFSRNYACRLRNLHPNEGDCRAKTQCFPGVEGSIRKLGPVTCLAALVTEHFCDSVNSNKT